MTKKKIRYSEFPTAGEPAPDARTPEAAPAPIVAVPEPAAPLPPLPRATVTMSLARLTPAQGAPVAVAKALRLTPAAGAAVIGAQGIRLTPIHGSVVIPVAPSGPEAEASRSLRERVRQRTGILELLVFRLANELFGIDLAAVEEAIDLPPVRHVPEMPPAMLGVITVRGSLTSTYSPESALGLSLASRGSALIFKRGRGRVALVVDDVDDVFTLDLAQLREAPGGDGGDAILLGVLRRGDALLGLVDAEALITACQAVPVLETA
jgi:chemotaxis signal transduction protein